MYVDERKFLLLEDDLTHVYSLLEQCLPIDNCSCYILGQGGKPKSFYTKLKIEENGYKVIWHGNVGPFWTRSMGAIIPAQFGLVKITDSRVVADLFANVGQLSMILFFSISRAYQDSGIIERLLLDVKRNKVRPEDILKGDQQFFYLSIDFDAYDEERQGYLSKAGFGENCSSSLLELKKYMNAHW